MVQTVAIIRVDREPSIDLFASLWAFCTLRPHPGGGKMWLMLRTTASRFVVAAVAAAALGLTGCTAPDAATSR